MALCWLGGYQWLQAGHYNQSLSCSVFPLLSASLPLFKSHLSFCLFSYHVISVPCDVQASPHETLSREFFPTVSARILFLTMATRRTASFWDISAEKQHNKQWIGTEQWLLCGGCWEKRKKWKESACGLVNGWLGDKERVCASGCHENLTLRTQTQWGSGCVWTRFSYNAAKPVFSNVTAWSKIHTWDSVTADQLHLILVTAWRPGEEVTDLMIVEFFN